MTSQMAVQFTNYYLANHYRYHAQSWVNIKSLAPTPARPVIKELERDARVGCLLEKLKLKQHVDMTHGLHLCQHRLFISLLYSSEKILLAII